MAVEDIGGGVTIKRFACKHQKVGGIIETHKNSEREDCSGVVNFCGKCVAGTNRPTWTVNSLDPLDIDPSIQCNSCPHHGFIRNGKWVASNGN